MELNECYWCESPISRPSKNMAWVDDYENYNCEFHPVAFNSATLKSTGEPAPHHTIDEVYAIIKTYYYLHENPKKKHHEIDDNVVLISKKAQHTSRKAADNFLPRSGSVRRLVYETIKSTKYIGITDYELEKRLGGKHQTISASRRSLVLDGFIKDSGERRNNEQGNECIVWVEHSYIFKETLLDV